MKDAVFEPGGGRTIAGAEMERLCRTLSALEDSLVALERRGISLRAHAVRQDPVTGQLPIYHVFIGHGEHWFASRKTLDEFIAQQEQESGNELKLTDEAAPAAAADARAPTASPTATAIPAAACTSSSSTRSVRSTASWPSCGRWVLRSTA